MKNSQYSPRLFTSYSLQERQFICCKHVPAIPRAGIIRELQMLPMHHFVFNNPAAELGKSIISTCPTCLLNPLSPILNKSVEHTAQSANVHMRTWHTPAVAPSRPSQGLCFKTFRPQRGFSLLLISKLPLSLPKQTVTQIHVSQNAEVTE